VRVTHEAFGGHRCGGSAIDKLATTLDVHTATPRQRSEKQTLDGKWSKNRPTAHRASVLPQPR
jgi:hypothetical protein